MNPLEKLKSWWRGSTDPDSLAEAHRVSTRRDTVIASQNAVAKQTGGSLIASPTPDVVDPESDESTDSR